MSKISVGYNIQSTHDVSLNAAGKIYGFTLDGGPKGMVEGASMATSILANRQGAKFSDSDPTFSHIEQRTWIGGRGQENMSDDPSRFFDSYNCWTLSPDVLLPTLQWQFASGIRKAYSQLPGDMHWKSLTGLTAYLGRKFTTTATMDAKHLYLWLKKVGNPGNITAGIYPDVSGTPNMASPVVEKTMTAALVEDVVSFFGEFEFAAAAALSTTTAYWIIVTALTSDGRNYWDVGYDDHASGVYSADGSSWTSADDQALFYRLTEADVSQTFLPFTLQGVRYFVTKRDDQGNSQVFMNGDRGKVAAGATSTHLHCTGKTWVADQWIGCKVRINIGPGLGMTSTITDNDGDSLTFSPAMHVTPTDASHFHIYSTHYFTEITTPAPGKVEGVAVANDVAYMTRGYGSSDVCVQQFRYKQADGAHEGHVDDSAKGTVICSAIVDGVFKLAMANSANGMYLMDPVGYSSELAEGTSIQCGDDTWLITGLIGFNGTIYVLKEDKIGYLSNNKFVELNVGLDAMAEKVNGAACAVQDTYLWFSWAHSAERLAGGTVDDEGPWSGAGLPEGRNGHVACLQRIVGHMLAAIDSGRGTGWSSVMGYNGMGYWTEILRSHNDGKRIRMVNWQACPDARPRLWSDVGGDLVYQVFPHKTLNPLRDSALSYVHESTLTSSTIDLDVAILPKFFKEISATTENLGSHLGFRRVHAEYQMDQDVGTSNWVPLVEFAYSPEETKEMNQGNRRQMRWRIRLTTEIATSPAKVRAIVVSAYAKLPAKRVWTLRIKLSSLSRDSLGGPNVSPTELYKWLWAQSRSAGGVFMRAKWEDCDGVWVVVEPPGLVRSMVNTIQQWWAGVATLTLREA